VKGEKVEGKCSKLGITAAPDVLKLTTVGKLRVI
jgi:hypothetical protein